MDKFNLPVELADGLFPDKIVRDVVAQVDNTDLITRSAGGYNSLRVRNEAGACIFERHGTACFAPVFNWINKQGYTEDFDGDPEDAAIFEYKIPEHTLTRAQVLRWLELGRKVGAVSPKVADLSSLKNIKAMLDHGWCRIPLRNTTLSIAELYLTLCFLRWLREGGNLIKATMRLVEVAGREFWSSLAFCHFRNRGQCTEQGLYPFIGTYYNVYAPEGSISNLGFARRIRQIAAAPGALDDRLVVTAVESNDLKWSWHQHCQPKINFCLAHRAMMLADTAFPIIWADTDEEAQALLSRAGNLEQVPA